MLKKRRSGSREISGRFFVARVVYTEQAEGVKTSWQHILLFVLTVTLYNIPKGLIPDSQTYGHSYTATWCVIIGVCCHNDT